MVGLPPIFSHKTRAAICTALAVLTATCLGAEPTIEVHGRVLSGEGPVTGATVRLIGPDFDRFFPRYAAKEFGATSTAADGTFSVSVSGVARTMQQSSPWYPWHLEYEEASLGRQLIPIDHELKTRLQSQIVIDTGTYWFEPAECAVVGQVRSEESETFPTARVLLWRDDLDRGWETVTGSEGKFTLDRIPTGEYTIAVQSPDRSPKVLGKHSICAGKSTQTNLGDILLEPWRKLNGRITDENGRPLEDVEVRTVAIPPRGATYSWLQLPAVSTSSDGLFQVLVPQSEKQFALRAEKAGFELTISPKPLRALGLFSEPPPVELSLVRNDRVTGSIVDSWGSGLGGVQIVRMETTGSVSQPTDPIVLSDKNGKFSLRGLTPGSNLIQFTKEGHEPTRLEVDAALHGTLPARVQPVLRPHGLVDIPVETVDAEDNPLSGVTVYAWDLEGDIESTVCERSIDGKCNLVVSLPLVEPASIWITGHHSRYGIHGIENYDISSGTARLKFEPLGRSLTRVTGTVTDEQGIAIAGATVEFQQITNPWPEEFTTATDLEGRFTFDRALDGSYSVAVRATGFAEFIDGIIAHPDGTELEIELEPSSILRGYLVGEEISEYEGQELFAYREESGALAQNSTVHEPENPCFIIVTTDGPAGLHRSTSSGIVRDAAFEIRNLGTGRWRIVADKYSSDGASDAIEISQASSEVTVEIDVASFEPLERECSSRENPDPIEDEPRPVAKFMYRSEWSDGTAYRIHKLQIAVDGKEYEQQGYDEDDRDGAFFAWYGAPRGDHIVRASSLWGEHSVPVTIPGDPVVIRFPPMGSVRVLVPELELAYPHEWPEGTEVVATPLFGSESATSSLRGLTPGPWRIDIHTPDGRSWSGEANVEDRKNTTLRLYSERWPAR